HRPRYGRHERVLDGAFPALPRDRLRHELEDDPEERPDDRSDEQDRGELVLLGRRQVLDARDEHDRERVRDRPDHERDVPEDVSLREIDVALDEPHEADELVAHRRAYGRHANTSLNLSSWSSSSNVRPVAAKNASSSVSTPKRRFTS